MNIARRDLLPEYRHYSDDGCDEAPKCVECPLAICRYDQPEKLKRLERAEKHDRIFELVKAGVPPIEIHRNLGVSTRTIHRIRQRGGASPTDRGVQLELDDVQGKPTSAIGSPIHAPKPYPVMRENVRRAL